MLATNDWLAVFYTDDGPFVYGTYADEDAAFESIIAFYQSEYGLSREDAEVRYDNTGDEWVTKLIPTSQS